MYDPAAVAQTSTGNVVVTVEDSRGSPLELENVTRELGGHSPTQAQLSEAQEWRDVMSLDVGVYTR